jgi:hypothetical protein
METKRYAELRGVKTNNIVLFYVSPFRDNVKLHKRLTWDLAIKCAELHVTHCSLLIFSRVSLSRDNIADAYFRVTSLFNWCSRTGWASHLEHLYVECLILIELNYYATSRKVTGSIPDDIIRFFHWPYPSSRTIALESTQTLTRNEYQEIFLGVRVRSTRKVDNLTAISEPIV